MYGYYHQRGIGLLELMLALAIVVTLLIMSIRAYQTYKLQANVQLVLNDIQTIQAAANAFFLANCSSIQTGTWQDLSMLSDFLPEASTFYNPFAVPFSKGNYYEIQFVKIANTTNVVLCIQANLQAIYPAESYYQTLGATAVSKSQFCSASGDNAIVWQSLPTVEKPGFMNFQVVERLKAFRKANMTGSSLCPT